jgi:SAM-dependent methyltransferase
VLPDCRVFEQALALFHRHSLQNGETVRQLQARGLLPTARHAQFAVLDIGAGEGHLPRLMQPLVATLVALEPNPACAQRLRADFTDILECRWDEQAALRLRGRRPEGFDLVTMSHMLYHFDGLADIRDKIALALALLKPRASLAIVINRPSAPMARIGTAFQCVEGRFGEAGTNLELHGACHDPRFYRALSPAGASIAVDVIDTPLQKVPSRATLTALLRMPLLDPLSEGPCDTARLDRFIGAFLDAEYPDLAYPADIPSQDDLVVVTLAGTAPGRFDGPQYGRS